MQETQCRKGNVGTHSMQMIDIGKGKDADLGLCQDGARTIKKGEAGREFAALGKGAGLLNRALWI